MKIQKNIRSVVRRWGQREHLNEILHRAEQNRQTLEALLTFKVRPITLKWWTAAKRYLAIKKHD